MQTVMDDPETEPKVPSVAKDIDHVNSGVVMKDENYANFSPVLYDGAEIDKDVAFVTAKLISSVDTIVDSNNASAQQNIDLKIDLENDPKSLENDDFRSPINEYRCRNEKKSIDDDLFRRLLTNFKPTDVPHTKFNRRTERIELQKASSEWIRMQICSMLDVNVNPDPFVRNVEGYFGPKMIRLIVQFRNFVEVLVEKLDVCSLDVRPNYLMCLMTEHCATWPTKFHAPSPVFRPTSPVFRQPEVSDDHRTKQNWRGDVEEGRKLKRESVSVDGNSSKNYDNWEKFVWNQQPPSLPIPLASVSVYPHEEDFRFLREQQREDEVFRRNRNESQPNFYDSQFDFRASEVLSRSRSPLLRYDERPPSANSSLQYDNVRPFESRFHNEPRFGAFEPDFRSFERRYGSFSRPDYSSGYGRDWCSREDVERTFSDRPY